MSAPSTAVAVMAHSAAFTASSDRGMRPEGARTRTPLASGWGRRRAPGCAIFASTSSMNASAAGSGAAIARPRWSRSCSGRGHDCRRRTVHDPIPSHHRTRSDARQRAPPDARARPPTPPGAARRRAHRGGLATRSLLHRVADGPRSRARGGQRGDDDGGGGGRSEDAAARRRQDHGGEEDRLDHRRSGTQDRRHLHRERRAPHPGDAPGRPRPGRSRLVHTEALTMNMIDTNTTLAAFVSQHPPATAVFLRHRLDFCCRGDRPLAQACRQAGLDPTVVADEIEAELVRVSAPLPSLAGEPLAAVIDHIVERYHRAHRVDMPALLAAARAIERVHRAKPSCPHGLADHLEEMFEEMSDHMAKEEQVLFPMIRAGLGASAAPPIRVLRAEHEDHARRLTRTRELTADLVAPAEACATWRSLYDGLRRLESELMEHVHLENHVLFPRALDAKDASSSSGRSPRQ